MGPCGAGLSREASAEGNHGCFQNAFCVIWYSVARLRPAHRRPREQTPMQLHAAASRVRGTIFVLLYAASGVAAEPVEFTLRADWFERGNVAVAEGGEYADRFACIYNAGELPNQLGPGADHSPPTHSHRYTA
jgi:hypothetical protein